MMLFITIKNININIKYFFLKKKYNNFISMKKVRIEILIYKYKKSQIY